MVLTMKIPVHIPVLLKEVVDLLQIQPEGRYIDCTVGSGGHSRAILEKISSRGRVLAIDADPEAIKVAAARLSAYSEAVILVNDNFSNLKTICAQHDFFPVQGILFDLGISSMQLEAEGRGFSFQHDSFLDMRFNPSQELTASKIVNTFSEAELARLLTTYGEERFSQQIASTIVCHRPVTTTFQLVRLIEKAIGKRRGRIHPATRSFQALRIAVNRELENLEKALGEAIEVLSPGGRLVVISYHSLEDRIVKEFMKREAKACLCPLRIPLCLCGHVPKLRVVTKKVIRPNQFEVKSNPRSRSAKLRAAERL